jgi:hypothetical protein
MMASRPFAASSAQRLIDIAVPALAGLAVLFVAFAAPADLLDRAVEASGLPAFLHAAAPPLGMKARLALGGAGGIAVFAIAFALLCAIDRLTARPARAAPVLAPAPETPRLRRRDLHPDAPPRPPISALRDLGEPAPPASPIERPEPAPPAGRETAEPRSEPPGPPAVSRQESLADLMARLERGLARRAAAKAPPLPAAASIAPRAFLSPSNDRLASAIENLQRLAAIRRG